MNTKTIFIALLVAAFIAHAPSWSYGQSATGSSSWGSFNNADPDDNSIGGGSWGFFNNAAPNPNGSGNGSWGNFTSEGPGVPLGSGLALLAVAGMGYACAKRRKAKKA